MDDVKIGEILLPGDEDEQERQSRRVKKRFWPVLKRAMRQVPFSRDLVASYYCALDPRTPTKVRGILLAALAYFVLPLDGIPDFFAIVGFSDDIAVLTAAFAAIRGHIREDHYASADKALADEADMQPAGCAGPAGFGSNSCPIPCAFKGIDGFHLTNWGLGTPAFPAKGVADIDADLSRCGAEDLRKIGVC